MPLISIIVPVYNAEKYIHKCLDSILAQTHTNWEAILVDDGSPDNCGAICDEYAAKDNRFKVIHQENGGVSVARQTGLDNTQGEYVIHCDPDDWVEANMLEEMLKCAIENNADMVICDFIEEYHNHSIRNSQNIKTTNSKLLRNKLLQAEIFGALWNKLIKKDCIKNINFTPANIFYSEDELFIVRTLNQEISVAYLNRPFYHYNRTDSSSITNNVNDKLICSKIAVVNEYEKFIDINEVDKLYEMKYHVLKLLFYSRKFKELNNLYPEIHAEIIKRNAKHNFAHPIGFFMAMSLRGFPRTSYLLFKINNRLVTLKGLFHI